jgi:hypothetical protein
MSRSLDLAVESPASVEQIVSAFGDRAYWEARLAEFGGGTATLDDLTVDDAGGVTVALRLGLVRDRLPKVVTQLHNGDLEMLRKETWQWADDGHVRGDIDVRVSGAPVSAIGQAFLSRDGDGSRLTYNATIKVKIPLVGGKIESYMCGQTVDEITKLQDFTNSWIAENPS